MFVVAIVGLLAGVCIGIVSQRLADARRRLPPTPTPDPADDELPDDHRRMVAAAIEAADRLDLALVLHHPTSDTTLRNRAATAMLGTHVGVIVDEHVDRAIAAASAGQSTDKRLDLHGPPRASLELVAEPLADGWVLVTVDDVSDRTRIDAMRTDFVANISHELKTPVGAIAVLAEMLEDETDPEVVARVASRVVAESHRAVTTIDDLLELSRIESTRLADDIVDLSDIVDGAVARGRGADGGERVEVTAFGAKGDIVLRADRRQLTSAIGNLVENAVKYSDDDGVVQVRTRADDRWVEVMVSDQGVGIPTRDLDRVFERFYRVDRARSRETGGTGLGLSIVRHVASNHGGECVVSSQEGEGSTFVLRLPASLVVDAADLTDTNESTESTSTTHQEMTDE
ncbi:sensor histidine kinase [Ilumatobacter coccineus]|uniref:Sensor-like histidine kinase SenX3 n=1 Tax=Ilumatobacter coccineus (strain NBRC 103263 / KCTC 29153 / YM16-304) TaxID=1313172 RepID=A0A6C7E914_ILUCY|nr:ATP-binding protein [Ilumatobacter coccineus]BAN01088.1 two-component histidine kinase PhoR [Ilumatobacter coccineus YM16-304]